MAPPPAETTNKSKGKSKKTQKTSKRKKTTPKQPDKEREKERDKIPAIPRLDANRPGGIGLDKVPSNAPTMAIAPSDYEHIFHEGPGGGAPSENTAPSRSPQNQMGPVSPPLAPLPPVPAGGPRTQTTGAGQYATQDYSVQQQQQAAPVEPVQVTPDGYTILGQVPLDANTSGGAASRRIALPPHVVRASNQFSRAVLARVARYLASRAEPY